MKGRILLLGILIIALGSQRADACAAEKSGGGSAGAGSGSSAAPMAARPAGSNRVATASTGRTTGYTPNGGRGAAAAAPQNNFNDGVFNSVGGRQLTYEEWKPF